jgi:hypothetical protein
MTKPSTNGMRNKPRSVQTTALPLRWINLPHQELYRRAIDSMAPGSRERAKEDALRHGLKRRLREMKQVDHGKYVEIECCRIVESLRAIRDQYRNYLEDKGCKPISEMYWVVFRFGIMKYAVRLLREIASEYVICSEVPFEEWEILYGNSFLPMVSLSGDRILPDFPETPPPQSVRGQINSLVLEQTFLRVMVGGPFGYEGQMLLTHRNPAFAFWGRDLNFQQIMERRQLLWKKCCPWTQGLAQLFDSTQEEIHFQYSLLAVETSRLESALELSVFETIAHEHLQDMRRNTTSCRNFGNDDWLKLFDVLDNSGVVVDEEFREIPRRVLAEVRRKGHKISSWKDCYQFEGGVRLENGKTYILHRQATHEVQNAAKRAAYRLATIRNQKIDSGRSNRAAGR